MSRENHGMKWMMNMKVEYGNQLNKQLDEAVKRRDGWFLVALKALLKSNQQQKELFVRIVLGKHFGFTDGTVLGEDSLFK
jgi:hypothetical protein